MREGKGVIKRFEQNYKRFKCLKGLKDLIIGKNLINKDSEFIQSKVKNSKEIKGLKVLSID